MVSSSFVNCHTSVRIGSPAPFIFNAALDQRLKSPPSQGGNHRFESDARYFIVVWSSLVRRKFGELEIAGSNPVTATAITDSRVIWPPACFGSKKYAGSSPVCPTSERQANWRWHHFRKVTNVTVLCVRLTLAPLIVILIYGDGE